MVFGAMVLVAAFQSGLYLRHGNDVYAPSPVYAVTATSVDSRSAWSPDGSRLAHVSYEVEPPRAAERRIAIGDEPTRAMRLVVWSRDTGRTMSVLSTGKSPTGINEFAFAGRDLVFTTFTATEEKGRTIDQTWVARDGDVARPLAVPEGLAPNKLVSSPRSAAVLLLRHGEAWILNSTGLRALSLPTYKFLLSRGVDGQGRAILVGFADEAPQRFLRVDFATGSVTPIADAEAEVKEPLWPYRLEAIRMSPSVKTSVVPLEDGGIRYELRETAGAKPIQFPFILDAGSDLEISPDGLSFAFTSNRVLMVRSLVKLSPSAAKSVRDRIAAVGG